MAPNSIRGTADVDRIEAPVTLKAYLMCAFASFGGIYFGYDVGWIRYVLLFVSSWTRLTTTVVSWA
jgi:hypothetical protein